MSWYWVCLGDQLQPVLQPLTPTMLNAPSPVFCGKEMKVNWATSPSSAPKQDTSKHYHIFVGDLSPDIETHQLREAFSAFGDISDCKIIRDPQTLKSKGYGFVSFVKKEDASNAIQTMNGQWVGARAIRTNWATRKPPAPNQKESQKPMSYEEVFNQSSPTNCTVYVGNVSTGLTEEGLRKGFSAYGSIVEIRVFADKGYAFIKFDTKENATQAILEMHGREMNGYSMKCSWGKEPEPSASPAATQAGSTVPSQAQQQFGQQYGGGGNYYNMGYWGYPQGYQGVQQGSYMQPTAYMQQGYGYPSNMNVQMPWPGMQVAPSQQQQQQQQQYSGQQGMMGYPMQQGQ